MSTLWSADHVQLCSGETVRIRDLSVEVREGVTAVLGYSGAGKTSLLNLLVGFEKCSAGDLTCHASGSLPVFWVPQSGGLWNHMTAEQHIMNASPDRVPGEWLEKLGLRERASSFPGQLSQGERGRLAVARALATEATVLVMDEPLAHVDPARLSGWFDIVVGEILRTPGRSLVFATHQPELALRCANHVICLDAGSCAFAGSVHDLYENPPNSRLAGLLGVGNWISQDERRVWLDQTGGGDGVIRPERLKVVPADDQRLQVVCSTPLGTVTETTLRIADSGQERCFVHASGPRLKAGDRVRLDVSGEQEETTHDDE